ncbi:MAG: pyridoxamine 5'-phosphate oxidase family protein [Mycobacterium sp.]|nr:pyridoxamine 5'-phosphate oxidase family protein [Mycobacterium sp.]
MALSKAEREQFLAEPRVAALSVSAGNDRGPLTVPIWYQYQYSPAGDPWVLTGLDSRKHRLIEAAGSFTLMVERSEPSLRYVAVSGSVAGIAPATDAKHREMAARYVTADKLEAYLTYAESYGEQVAITMRPQHWLSADLGSL